MKKHITLVIIIFILMTPCEGYALDSGMDLSDAETINPDEYLNNVTIDVLDHIVSNLPFEEYVIGPNKEIALMVREKDNTYVYVFSSKGDFLYGFCIYSPVVGVSIEWEDQDIGFFFHRSNVFLTYDKNGNCTHALQIRDETYREGRIINYHSSTSLEGVEYRVEGNPIIYGGRKSLLRIADNETIEIYSAKYNLFSSPVLYMVVLLIWGGIIIKLYKTSRLKKHAS